MRRMYKRMLPLLAWAVAIALGGCIRDNIPDCPPLQVTLTVKDKNYFNIDDAVKLGMMERKADNLPFRDYVATLYYIVTDGQGTVVAEQKNTAVDNDLQQQTITLPADLPYGDYTVTAWGNMKSEEPLGDDASAAELEAVGAAANDIYLASATFNYRYGSEKHTLALERTKGNLLIKAEGIPDNIDFSTKNISDVFGRINASFSYSGLTDIHTELSWNVHNNIQTQTLMCPSASYEGSTLQVRFMDSSTLSGSGASSRAVHAKLEPSDVNITMGRNEITILKYVYDTDSGTEDSFSIYLRVNGNWELLHDMELD